MHLEIEQRKKRKRRPVERALQTSNTQIKVEGSSLQHLFKNSLRGLGHLLSPGSCSSVTHYNCIMIVRISADNPATLLVDFLTKVLEFTHRHQAIFCIMDVEEITEKKFVGQIFGTCWFKNFDAAIKSIDGLKCSVKRNEDFSYTSSIVFECGI
ncbi:archease [Maribacter halichondriae]|uniref:archease n=1 Tax=Maribacter halichondriae TaxID=2980554 RepID=UPI002359F8B8|nr:archease [Maribacter sp. Hal144]